MKTKRYAAVAAGAVGLALALTGCGGGDNGANGGADNGTGEITNGVAGGSEITFQTWNLMNDRFTPYFEALIEEFESLHEGVSVRWIDHPADGFGDSLAADAAAGTLPDVMNLGPDHAFMLASAGKLVDLSVADPNAASLYLEKAWDGLTFDTLGGGTFAYPWYLNTGPSFFNTAIFAECGLDPEALPTNFDELFAQAAVLSANCPDKRMISNTPALENFGEAGVQLMNEDQTEFVFNNADGVAFLEKYIELFNADGMTLADLDAVDTATHQNYVRGEIAWYNGSAMDLVQIRENAPEVYENTVTAERLNSAAPNMWMHSIGVNADSANVEMSMEFARFLTNNDNQLEFSKLAGIFPSSADGLTDPWFTEEDGTPESRVRVQTAAFLPDAVMWRPVQHLDPDAVELREQIALAMIGQQTAQEALDNAVAFSNQRLAVTAGN